MTRVLKGPGFLALLLLGTLLSSCSSEDTHEAIMKDHLALMEKAAAILEAVENKDSATEAGKKLEQLSAQFEELAKRSEAIGTLDKDSRKALQDKFKSRQKEVGDRLAKASFSAITKGGEMQKLLQDLGKAMATQR
jgi:hypothetical protein